MHKVGTVSQFGTFTTSVLLRWRGGLFQAIYPHIFYYILAYIFLATIYIYILQEYEGLTWYRWWVHGSYFPSLRSWSNHTKSGLLVLVLFVFNFCQTYSLMSLNSYYSLYEQFVLAVEEQANDLSGMIRLMIGFFVSQVCRRWWWQFQVSTGDRGHAIY